MESNVVKKLDVEEKEKLEIAYGVYIHKDALIFTVNLLLRCSEVFMFDDEEGGANGNGELILQKKAVELLDKACASLKDNLDSNVEEIELDKDEYNLRRGVVELTELKKEKHHACRIWIPRVERECEGLRDKWVGFIKKWKPILLSPSPRAEVLLELGEIVSCLQKAVTEGEVKAFAPAVQQLGAPVFRLLQTVHDEFKQNRTVGPCKIAEVASTMTGVPASLLLRFLELPPLEDLGPKLCESLIGQEHVIDAITSALSKPKSGHRPIASFLFLGISGFGRTELSKAIARQLFGQEDMLIEFDMSQYTGSDSVSRLIGDHSSDKDCSGSGRLTEAVKRRPFCVLMFDYVDKAHASVKDILFEILVHGKLIDGQGSVVDFTSTVIIMKSNAGDDKFRMLNCGCVKKIREFPIKDMLKAIPQKSSHECQLLPLLREAEGHFKPGFFEFVDDVIVIGWLSYQQFRAVARQQLRDIAISMIKKGIILYPSEAALGSIVVKSLPLCDGGGHAIRIWLENNLVPVLSEMFANNEVDDLSVIYIDALFGTFDYSYRVGNREGLVEGQIHRQLNELLRKLRIMHKKTKDQVNKIYLLKRNYFKLITLLDKVEADLVHVSEAVGKLGDIMDDLITDARDVNLVCNELEASLNFLNGDVELKQGERPKKRDKTWVTGVRSKLCSRMVGRHQAIDVVTKALLRSIDASDDMPHRPAKSFLFLGLTSVGKEDLVKKLAEHLVVDDGTNLLIQFNLSEYTDADSFFRCTGIGQPGLQLVEMVRMWPHSVIVFHELEKAHISIVSTLLSVLDYGVLNDSHGVAVDFRNTVVILCSDLGNKKLISQLVGLGSQECGGNGEKEQGTRGFRAELLNRVDEIVFFDPFVHDQLGKVARLSMRTGPHLEEGPPSSLPCAFLHLFLENEIVKTPPGMEHPTISLLKKGLIRNGRVRRRVQKI